MTIRIAAFYKFFDFPGFEAARPCLSETLEAAGVRGTVLLAAEGIDVAVVELVRAPGGGGGWS